MRRFAVAVEDLADAALGDAELVGELSLGESTALQRFM
jgi:hypothetical protein